MQLKDNLVLDLFIMMIRNYLRQRLMGRSHVMSGLKKKKISRTRFSGKAVSEGEGIYTKNDD